MAGMLDFGHTSPIINLIDIVYDFFARRSRIIILHTAEFRLLNILHLFIILPNFAVLAVLHHSIIHIRILQLNHGISSLFTRLNLIRRSSIIIKIILLWIWII